MILTDPSTESWPDPPSPAFFGSRYVAGSMPEGLEATRLRVLVESIHSTEPLVRSTRPHTSSRRKQGKGIRPRFSGRIGEDHTPRPRADVCAGRGGVALRFRPPLPPYQGQPRLVRFSPLIEQSGRLWRWARSAPAWTFRASRRSRRCTIRRRFFATEHWKAEDPWTGYGITQCDHFITGLSTASRGHSPDGGSVRLDLPLRSHFRRCTTISASLHGQSLHYGSARKLTA